jgi:hypothetical protein
MAWSISVSPIVVAVADGFFSMRFISRASRSVVVEGMRRLAGVDYGTISP